MNEEFQVLSNKVVKYLNDSIVVSQMAHWCCEGSNFYEFHKMTERIYNDLSELMDPLIEQLRSCGFMPKFDLLKGPGIEFDHNDCHYLGELVLDYVMALNSAIMMYSAFTTEHGHDPRLVGVGNQLQTMASVVLTDQYLLQSYLA